MVMNRSTKKYTRGGRRRIRCNGRSVMVTFANRLRTMPTIRDAVAALDAGHGKFDSGMHFDVDGVEYVVALFTDVVGVTYCLVGEWDGSSLTSVQDLDWVCQLMDLAEQIARRGNAS